MKPSTYSCLLLCLSSAAVPAQDAPPKRRVEDVARSGQAYVVVQGGTMDGRNCRSPAGVYEGWTQTWESNRSVRMENVGESDVVNPWLSNGRNNFRTAQEIIASAVRPGMSDREKALALYDQQIRHRWHWHGDNDELGDPVKVFNVYGHNTCGNDSICLAGLWKRAGLRVAPACAVGHCISQVYFDGRWNVMDGDQQGLYLLRDGRTIASEVDLARDHDLVKRAHTLGILHPASRSANEGQAALFVLEGGERGTRDSAAKHTMDMTLRPGEALVWRWGHRSPLRVHGEAGIRAPGTVANGLWEYRPDLARETWRKGAERAENVRSTPEGLAAEAGKTATIEWSLKIPYVLVGGKLETEGPGARFEVSVDGTTWKAVEADLDSHFPPTGRALYAYRLRCTLAGEARLKRLAILNDLQMAPLALPEMVVGENRFTYTDATTGARAVRITHEWVERSTTRPPDAPAAAVAPPNGGDSAGSQISFAWRPAKDADGDNIADYHFQLSDRPDFAYTLSSTFNRLMSKVADRVEERFVLPRPGLLAPGLTYFWRVRAKDDKGAWGAWGGPWSFKAGGPGVPLEVRIEMDGAKEAGMLRWALNPAGTPPLKYRIYGSDEKGFSISDEPYDVLGSGRVDANFVAESTRPEAPVVGRGSASNRAYYRVVAVDAAGHRSADSDAAASPRPFLHAPPVAARAGHPFKLTVASIRSLGDVKTRDASKPETRFWEVERPTFTLAEGPAWLKIDPASGVLSGTPPVPGRVSVAVTCTLEVEERRLDEKSLAWGQDKSLGTTLKTLGPARLAFVVDVEK